MQLNLRKRLNNMIGMIVNYTFLFTAILLCGALSGFLSERVGIVNIGIDGMMCFGALFFGILSSPVLGMSNFGPGMLIIPLILTMLFTGLAGLMHGFATIKLKANHIISGTAVNLIGLALATFLNYPLGQLLYGKANLASGFTDFLFVGNSIYGSSIILFIGVLLIATILFIIMMFTKTGLRYRAVGENPNAVDAQFINVNKYQ
jgi:simple sugar transport system permease protein